MGIFSKLAFWKKKDDLALENDFGSDLGLGKNNQYMGPNMGLPPQQGVNRGLSLPSRDLGMPDDIGGGMGQGFGLPQQQAMPPGQPLPMQQPFGVPMQPPQPKERDYRNDKFEVVSAKLDSIRYTLDSINQRLASLERLAYGEREERRRW